MRRRRERSSHAGGARELPDAKIVPFPDNHLGDHSAGAAGVSWGPAHDIQPLRVGEVVLVDRGGLIATFAVYILLGRGVGKWERGYRLVRWGVGQRVFPPQSSRTVPLKAPDDDGKVTFTGETRTYYAEMMWFDSNRGAKAFEEAALAAVRPVVARLRSEQPSRSAAFLDGGAAKADDVPF
jgi:hypothetical protein